MPPDFVYNLPPVLIFATVLATVGAAALLPASSVPAEADAADRQAVLRR